MEQNRNYTKIIKILAIVGIVSSFVTPVLHFIACIADANGWAGGGALPWILASLTFLFIAGFAIAAPIFQGIIYLKKPVKEGKLANKKMAIWSFVVAGLSLLVLIITIVSFTIPKPEGEMDILVVAAFCDVAVLLCYFVFNILSLVFVANKKAKPTPTETTGA